MKTPLLDIRHADCMDLMAGYADDHFDLAVADPPYGIGMHGQEWNNTPRGQKSIKGKSKGLRVQPKQWDNATPDGAYFKELERVSKHRIIWGGNYFTDHLPPEKCWLSWDKKQPDGVGFSQFELAWTSLGGVCKTFRMYPTHVAQGVKTHPTQKPIKLYKWIFANYAERGMKVLDTHLGSGTIAIAAHYAGIHLTASELDPDYYKAACERIQRETAQTELELFG